MGEEFVPTRSPFWDPYADFLCQSWNDRLGPERRIDRLSIWYIMKVRDGFGQLQTVKGALHDQNCGEATSGGPA